jgi:hypothetical protein
MPLSFKNYSPLSLHYNSLLYAQQLTTARCVCSSALPQRPQTLRSVLKRRLRRTENTRMTNDNKNRFMFSDGACIHYVIAIAMAFNARFTASINQAAVDKRHS